MTLVPADDSMQLQADRRYQESALIGVSRSFAFTIPELPQALRPAVINAYLLCRIADTIEDHATLDRAAKQAAFAALVNALSDARDAHTLAQSWLSALAADTPTAERELIGNLARVLRVTSALPPNQRTALSRCVRVLCEGMGRFEALKGPRGLADLAQFDDYCYYVAGVVGEMLTTLFCDYNPAMAKQRQRLMRLAVSFGRGLQMTNILKDIWEDRARGVCWLPRDVFARYGCTLSPAADWALDPGFHAGIGELVARAHGQLLGALDYTLQVPASEPGIRRFCSWAGAMALLTLRRISNHRSFTNAAQIKISRSQVARLTAAANFAVRYDWALRVGFKVAAFGLPAPIPATAGPSTDPQAVSP